MRIKLTLLFVCFSLQSLQAQFKYVSPVPGSAFHNRETNIILKYGGLINRTTVSNRLLEITGSKSGTHEYSIRLSDDNKSVIIKPKMMFDYDETVTVNVHSKLKSMDGQAIDGITFSFKIRNEITPEEKERYRKSRIEIDSESSGDDAGNEGPQGIIYPLDSMPTFQIKHNLNPPGRVFYCSEQSLVDPETNHFPTIIENDGTIIWARDLGTAGKEFKINNNGYLTYFKESSFTWMVMDSNYNLIDSVQCGNGYGDETSHHDLLMYPDGHVFLIAENNQTVDMTAYGGQPDATVVQTVLQELDANRDVVFEWRSFDHFQFTDAISQIPLTNKTVDYCHTNSIEKDFDGNIMISSRNLSELTKIDHETGDIIWRMGGENNQFTFVNDNIPGHFSKQHDLRRLPNGNITIFNNGNYFPVQRSSAKEYQLDEVNKVATLVWYYEHPDTAGHKVFGTGKGSVQRLSNGNTMICWGLIAINQGIPNFTEVDSNKQIVWEMTFDEPGQQSYRAHRYDWNPCSRVTGYTMKANVKPAEVILSWQPATGMIKYELKYRVVGSNTWLIKNLKKKKVTLTGLAPNTTYEWKVKTRCTSTSSSYSVGPDFTTNPLKLSSPEENVFVTENSFVEIYPNPFSEATTISFSLQEDSHVAIELFDLTGREIKTLLQENLDAGNHELNFNRVSIISGIYFLRIKMNDETKTEKLVIE